MTIEPGVKVIIEESVKLTRDTWKKEVLGVSVAELNRWSGARTVGQGLRPLRDKRLTPQGRQEGTAASLTARTYPLKCWAILDQGATTQGAGCLHRQVIAGATQAARDKNQVGTLASDLKSADKRREVVGHDL